MSKRSRAPASNWRRGQAPLQGGPQVIVLGVEHPQPGHDGRGPHTLFGSLAQLEEEQKVAVAGGRLLARGGQFLGGVGPDRVQQPVAVALVVDLDQGLVDQG